MLVARAQLDFVRDLVARFQQDDSMMRLVADFQSQYVAIVRSCDRLDMYSPMSTVTMPLGVSTAANNGRFGGEIQFSASSSSRRATPS